MTTVPSGLETVAEILVSMEDLCAKIPLEHRGVLFERVLRQFHPQENTRKLELAFAETWAERNDEYRNPLLCSLLTADDDDARRNCVPQTKREWQVACLVAATIVQWLPTSGGCSFLHEGFKRGGGRFSYELPPTDD